MKRLLALAAAAALLVGCGGDGGELIGITRDPEPRVDAVALPDVSRDGEPFEFRAAPGGLLVVYFGYTNCPDVCPTTLVDVRTALGDLGDDADRVDVAMVTVDPARDVDALADFVQSFVPDAHAIATDDDAALRSIADPFGMSYAVITAPDGAVEVIHANYLFGVDDTGTLVVTWPISQDPETTTSAEDLAHDMRMLLDDASSSDA